jgi:hypothetical protein
MFAPQEIQQIPVQLKLCQKQYAIPPQPPQAQPTMPLVLAHSTQLGNPQVPQQF